MVSFQFYNLFYLITYICKLAIMKRDLKYLLLSYMLLGSTIILFVQSNFTCTSEESINIFL